MTLEETVDKFVKHPSLITNGAPSLAKKWGVDVDVVYQARGVAKDIIKNKEEFGTEYNPKDVSFNVQLEDPEDTFLREFDEQRRKYANFTPEKALQELKLQEQVEHAKLVKKWGSEGNWKYSYDYSQNTASGINFEEILNKVFKSEEIVPQTVYNEPIKSKYNMACWLSDQHIGMSVEHSLYSNYYDKHIYKDRMNSTFLAIGQKSVLYGGFDTLTVNFLGDTFDGQDAFTVKRTHQLPQNMSNEECFETGLMVNKIFLERLFKSGWANNYRVYFVRESNHGGDMDLYLFKALKMWINTAFPQVQVVIANKVLDHYTVGNHTFIYGHGKDNRDMKNGIPLTLDTKTENFINQYIYEYNIKGFIHCVSADLHQDATTNAKLFRYRKVPALAGSSKWIMSNYGLTEPGVGYDIFDTNTNDLLSGVIKFTT